MPDRDPRVRLLNDRPVRGERPYVLYWMQQSQRTHYNHALAAAIDAANAMDRPLVVCFGLMDDYPEANARHYAFLLEGLRDVRDALHALGVRFVVRHGQPFEAAIALGRRAAAVYCDRGYLRHQKQWRDRVADGVDCRVAEVESDVVVPVDVATDKQEFAARTIRPRLHRLWPTFMVPMRTATPKHSSSRLKLDDVGQEIDVSDPATALATLKLDRTVKPSDVYRGGEREAQRRLAAFVARGLDGYDANRNEPADEQTSHLSAYLHFGQMSPLDAVLRVRDAKAGSDDDRDGFIEELAVRRELSMNFVHHCPHYDDYRCLPAWAQKTLAEHKGDVREQLYSRDELELGKTGDVYWNAAQAEMRVTGFMANYMRMYWAKRILGWTADPAEAFATTLAINNKFFLCGRDANAYANVAWTYGLHDRPWGPQRKVFGTVRYMNAGGLERKFDVDRYVAQMDRLARDAEGEGLHPLARG